MTEIKICGLSRASDIDCANQLPIQYIGFVFAAKSKRRVTEEEARSLRAQLNTTMKAVGVFVREEVTTVARLLNEGVIDIAQLHGGEDEAYIESLRKLTNKPIWKAFRVDSPEDILSASNCSADRILLDAGSGGTGTTFDWSLIQGLSRPFFLAGGLNLQNITSAIETIQPFGIDVSSGVETDGLKDHNKMQEFVQIVRDLDRKDSLT